MFPLHSPIVLWQCLNVCIKVWIRSSEMELNIQENTKLFVLSHSQKFGESTSAAPDLPLTNWILSFDFKAILMVLCHIKKFISSSKIITQKITYGFKIIHHQCILIVRIRCYEGSSLWPETSMSSLIIQFLPKYFHSD